MQKVLEQVIIGSALGFAASVLLPIVKETFNPLYASNHLVPNELTRKAKTYAQLVREELEDIYAEAQFIRMQKRLDREIFK